MRMKWTRILLCGLAAAVAMAGELKVNVYEGPTECDEADTVKVGDTLEMHYDGYIDESSRTGEPGKKFDSSRDRGDEFKFKLGQGQVIKCWDLGFASMKVGEKAVLTATSDMCYGRTGAGPIPPNADLTFEVELLAIDTRSIAEYNAAGTMKW